MAQRSTHSLIYVVRICPVIDGNRVKGTVGGTATLYTGEHFEWDSGASTMKKYYYASGQRIAMRDDGTLHFLLDDHLGSTAVTTNSSGGWSGEVRYKAWGEDRYTSGTTPTTFRLTGQRQEASLGGGDATRIPEIIRSFLQITRHWSKWNCWGIMATALKYLHGLYLEIEKLPKHPIVLVVWLDHVCGIDI